MDNKENEDINIEEKKSVEDVVSNMVDEANEDLDMFKEIVVDGEGFKEDVASDANEEVSAQASEDNDAGDPDEKDEGVGEDEINRAMEVVTTSKRKRDKAKKEPRLYAEDYKGKEVPDDDFKRFSFIDKCKKDPVIPVCILLIIALIVGAVLYYLIPMLGMKSFGFTLGQFTDRFVTTQIYSDGMKTWNFEFTDTHYQMTALTSTSSADSANGKLLDLTKMLDKAGVKYFDCDVSSSYDSDLLGCVSPLDDQLIYLRALSKYEDVASNPHYVTYYFATIYQTVFPSLSAKDAVDLSTEMLTNYDGSNEYTLMGDIACRIVMGTYNGTNYVAMDMTPRQNVGL